MSTGRKTSKLREPPIDPARSRLMSRIRAQDTSGERLLRKALSAKGYRYRLNVRTLPGKPDICLRKLKAVIFFHGCFWHWHGCSLCKKPRSRVEFWQTKLVRNRARDKENRTALKALGWRVLEVWECSVRGPNRLKPAALANRIEHWVAKERRSVQIPTRVRS